MEEELEHIGVVKDDCNGFPWKRIGYVCETDLAVLPIGAKVYGPNVVESLRTQIAAQAAVIEKLTQFTDKFVTELMDIAVNNGANSISMPDDYVEAALFISKPTDSKQILADWLDSVLGEPILHAWAWNAWILDSKHPLSGWNIAEDLEVHPSNKDNALGQEPCAAVCARSPAPEGYTSGTTEKE